MSISSFTDAVMPCQPDSGTIPRSKPELLAPARDRECLGAAIENGADAIYFGLKAHNARARAENFALEDLPALMALMRRRGVKGYVALNTLIFPGELEEVEATVRGIAEAGVDAVIVQDLGLARLVRAVSPDLEIHASTQMSITSAAGVELARELGCSRVILARELSLREIGQVCREVALPVEVFVHGALCVAYSGQCLTSEALGGRSANRGECAQACRMPYDVICDGKVVDLDRIKYLLSPQDLAAFDLVPELVNLGVASLKIEGRLKNPEYVATITRNYRHAIDSACAGRADRLEREQVYEMEMTFSRGFSTGFLRGNNHKTLVRGDYAKKRGVFLGHVRSIAGGLVELDLAAPIKRGDGVVFDGDESTGVPEQGGRVYEVMRPGRGQRTRPTPAGPEGLSAGPAALGFGHRDLDPHRIVPGQRVWKTDDPELARRLRQTFEGDPKRTIELDLTVSAVVGEPLKVSAVTSTGFSAHLERAGPLVLADRHPATPDDLKAQLGRLGGTAYRLRTLTATLDGEPLVPKSVLNAVRRELVDRLDAIASAAPVRTIAAEPVVPMLRAHLLAGAPHVVPSEPQLSALCRNTAQVVAAREAGLTRIYLDYQDIKCYSEGITAARGGEGVASVYIATPRIEKQGEGNIFRFLAKQGADGFLVRNAGGLRYCAERGLPFVADFSMNASNELSVELLLARGAERVTASYDLNADQLLDLLAAVPPDWLEVVIHQRMPMFLMEHCVFCAFLSPGTDKSNCGRPCDHHDVKLRDRVGMEHPLKADVGCRNTLFNAIPQTAAEFLPALLRSGARHLRVEFLDDHPEVVTRTLGLYNDAINGLRDARTLWKDLKATNQYGVTRGQLAVVS